VLWIEPFLQYGVLGIIGFIFIKTASSLFNKQSKQFETLIDNLLTEKKDSFDELKESSIVILQTINNQCKYMTQLLNNILNKLDNEVAEKKDILKLFLEQNELSIERNIKSIELLNEYKMVLYEIRTNCSCITNNKRQIGNAIVKKGLITQEQLDEIIEEQENDFLISMGIKNKDRG